MALPFFTIGHSTRSLDDFIGLLRGVEIVLLVDIRTIPRSRTNPQFNKDALPSALAPAGIDYEHIAALGGLRGKMRDKTGAAPEVNGFWTNKSFHNYADYALSEPFRAGLEHLRAEGHRRRCVIMCAEAVWWRCHRRIVTDYLIASGETVFHIMGQDRAGQDRLEPARLTAGAVVEGPDTIVYPAVATPAATRDEA
ncbi:MAG: DUF488 domain-containing protein [Rhizobiales bacterium]|nr:DUF488 domain-containing protein [Hyphomicrobiales bacterium]OJY44617.1 MAG: DNA repair protein [Rhizobiales bacterium 64-17]